MSELALVDLDSQKVHSNSERTPSAFSSWGDSNTPEKEEIPIHLFCSPSKSSQSSSSRSDKVQDSLRKETKFSSVSKNSYFKASAVVHRDVNVIKSPSHSAKSCSSSDSNEYSSRSKSEKSFSFAAKSKANIRPNKVHDFKTQEEKMRMRIEKSESETVSEVFKLRKIKHKKDSSVQNSSNDNNNTGRVKISTADIPYREKIRDRFNSMKERAVESLSRPQSRSQSRLKSLIVKQGGTKLEDLLRHEESEVSAAMERHEKMKRRWKEISKASLEKERKAQEENISIFEEAEEEEEEEEEEEISPGLSPEAEETKSSINPESVNDVEEPKMLTSELLGIKEDWEVIKYAKPKLANAKNDQILRKHIFYPSAHPVSIESKLEPGLAPRYIEKEGLYVGLKMKIPKKIKNKMEQRIMMDSDHRKWFGKDGELISSTCSLKPVSTRPYFDEDDSTSAYVTYKPATLGDVNHRYMDLSENSHYVLDIDINIIEFTHHPLFSREHVLAQRLKELYVKFKKRKEAEKLNRLNGRLHALRKTRDNIKNIVEEGGDNLNLRKKLEEYEEDIKEIREMRYVEGRIDKQLSTKIIMTWKDLVKLREQQGYQNTPIKLIVKKKYPEDAKEEKRQWDDDIKRETKEILDELRREKKLLENEENSPKRMPKRSKKVSDKTRSENRESDEDIASNSESDHREFIEKKSKSSKTIDEFDVEAEVVKNFELSFRNPGEPEIEFALSKITNLDVSAYNNKEELRRAAIKRCMVFIKLFYNGKEVCRSKPQRLNQNFTVAVSQRFAIRILEWPESLMIEIHEETGPLHRNLLVPGIYLPFPDSFCTVQYSDVVKHEFSNNISVTFNHAAVGSGNNITPCPNGSEYNNQPVCLFTSGTVACRTGWMNDNGKILAPPEKYWSVRKEEPITSLSEIFTMGGYFDVSKLKEWAENSKLDPNDPNNSAFFYFLENVESSEETKPSYFRLDPLLEEFDFCSDESIEENTRLKLLKLRDSGEPEFREMKMIPLNEKQIHKEIFKDYEKRISAPYPFTDILSSDPLDGYRAWGRKYLEEVQEKLLKQCRKSKQIRRFQDIITEESVPDIGTLGLTFMKWLRPKRPLRPVRKERKKITPQNLSGQDVNIVINVVRAFEVPIRKDMDGLSTGEDIEGFSLVNVRPFVEISFRGITARTTAAEGANPTWNQDLKIPVTSKNENFQSIKDTLYLHLFDEMIIDLIEDESARETNIHQRIEKRWLASMKIPFSTLYFNSRIEGTFKLYSPPVLLGYEREAHRRHFSGNTGQEPLLPQRDATYITLFVTVQPALNPPVPIKEKMETSENINLEKHLEGWQNEISNMFPHRKIKTLVLDITGKSVCVTRFVRSISVPPIAEEEKITPEMVARYVAMIPSIGESTIFPEFFDIWLTGDQLLRLMWGDSEDHASLLCCFFLHLGLEAYILLGSGIPHGLMAYVLVKKEENKTSEYFIWDPTNGQKYNITDSFCPLQKVYCLINNQNIWANIQVEEMPRRMRFDLSKRADWFPAFGKNMVAPTESIQPQSLNYKTTSRRAVDILQDKIEKKLRDNLMKWRKKSRTQWNRYCAATLRRLLPKLEESTWNVREQSPDHIVELQHILASHKMCGFPINMPYTTIEAVTEAVKATGVHCNESEGVEFALAVYIHPYTNDVLSVWVYVASLVKRR